MTTTMNSNGRVIRRSLAEQIDRLDGILDCLAEGLNGAVASAVKDAVALAVQEAVRGVLTEVLTDPDFLERLRSSLVPPTPVVMQSAAAELKGPTLKERLDRFRNQAKAKVGTVRRACGSKLRMVKVVAAKVLERCEIVRRFKWQLLMALGMGAVVSAGVYFAGPYVAAVAGWLGGFATTLAVQAGMALKNVRASISEA